MNSKLLISSVMIFLILLGLITFISAEDCKTWTCSAWSECKNNLKTRTCELSYYSGDDCTDIIQKSPESLPCNIMESNLICKDSDTPEEYNPLELYGVEEYEKGHLINEKQNADYWDTCTDLQNTDLSKGYIPTLEGKILVEYYCEGDNYQYKSFDCPIGCNNGACINPCIDTDNGNDFYTKGIAYIDYTGQNQISNDPDAKFTTDFCENEFQLREYTCNQGTVGRNSEVHSCPFGCEEGACLKIKPEKSNPVDISQKIEEIENETLKEEIKKEENYSSLCLGCVLDNKCYPFGYRKEGSFCKDDGNFIFQLGADNDCENNFECDSNLCIENKCVSGSIWAKFLNWFKRLFG